jgi:hypothetical protein
MIEADAAKKLGVSVATFEDYKNKYPEFLEAIKRGKAPVDFEVENALLKRALGYTFTETKSEVELLDGGVKNVKASTETIKEIAPDVTAQIFWLKNRNPERWRDIKQTELTGKNGKDLIPDNEADINIIINELPMGCGDIMERK